MVVWEDADSPRKYVRGLRDRVRVRVRVQLADCSDGNGGQDAGISLGRHDASQA